MKLDASRQPFVFSAAMGVLMAALFVFRRLTMPYPVEETFTGGMPLASMLAAFGVAHPWWCAAVVLILTVWTLLIVVQLTVKYAPVTGRNYLPIQMFIMVSGGILVSGEILAAVAAAWLLVHAVRQFIFSLHKEYRFTEVFRAGLYLGIIPLLYAPSVPLLVLLPMAMVIFRRTFREGLVCLVGAVTAIPVAGFVHWAMGESAWFIYDEIWQRITEGEMFGFLDGVPSTSMGIAGGAMLLLSLIAALWSLAHKKGARKKQYRFVLFLTLMLVVLLGTLAIPGSSATVLPLVAVSMSLSVSYAFSDKGTSIISSLIYCVVLVAVFALNLLPVLGYILR
jgi:hypothetical protein